MFSSAKNSNHYLFSYGGPMISLNTVCVLDKQDGYKEINLLSAGESETNVQVQNTTYKVKTLVELELSTGQ